MGWEVLEPGTKSPRKVGPRVTLNVKAGTWTFSPALMALWPAEYVRVEVNRDARGVRFVRTVSSDPKGQQLMEAHAGKPSRRLYMLNTVREIRFASGRHQWLHGENLAIDGDTVTLIGYATGENGTLQLAAAR